MSKIDPKKAREQLWRIGHLSWLLDKNQQALYELFHKNSSKLQTWLLARRCLAEGTLIKTPRGLIKIEDLNVGDEVFGYNKDGSISISKIKETFNNGIKEVWDLTSGTRVLETCTKDHTWLTINEYDCKLVERQVKDIKKYNKIIREWVSHSELIGINEPHAYAIGALLGDGCSKQGVRKIYISSQDNKIPSKVASILNCKYYNNSETNYTWCLSNEDWNPVGYASQGSTLVTCNYYNEWCKDRYAHEKIADLEIIKTWDPKSQLEFLAGIIDTDGSFYITEDCLSYRIGMQSLSVIEACQYIIHNLFQYKCNITIDNREKYKNGPLYCIGIKNNFIVKKMLRALNKYLVTDRKKWKPEYEMFLENNSNPSCVGIKVCNPRFMNTYDIHIDNDTNLYLTANGLVTHNSGKSYTLCILAIEYCIKHPNSVVKYVAPTKDQVENIILPIIENDILEKGGCPQDLKPTYNRTKKQFNFSNGSMIQIAGSESGNIDTLRGGFAHICILDEAQDISKLRYAISSVLAPTTLTTNGKILISGTPPQDNDHEFIEYIEECESRGTLIKRTIYDNPRLTKQQIQDQIDLIGGEHKEEFQREFLCKIIKSKSRSVIPEATDELLQIITKEWNLPQHYYAYTGLDIGGKDWTVALFGYYDFLSDKIIIQDEIAIPGAEMKLNVLASEIKLREEQLWTNPLTNEFIKPRKRVSDHNLVVINEIKRLTSYKVLFDLADKREKMVGLNKLRVLLETESIIIDPRCVTLIRHLKNCKWASENNKDDFARSPDGSHYDAVDALLYLVKAVESDQKKNPYPKDYKSPLRQSDAFRLDNNASNLKNVDVYKKMLNVKPSSSERKTAWLKHLKKE